MKKTDLLWLLWRSLSNRRKYQLVLLQLLSFAAALAEISNLATLLPLLNILTNKEYGSNHLAKLLQACGISTEALPIAMVALFSLACTISALFRISTFIYQYRLCADITADIGGAIFSNVLQREYTWHRSHNASKTLSYLTKDVDQSFDIVLAILQLMVNVVIVFLLAASLIILSPVMMFSIIALSLTFYGIVHHYTKKDLRKEGVRLSSNYAASIQQVKEALGGIRDVILDNSQKYFFDKYQTLNIAYRQSSAAINIKAQVPRYLIEGFLMIIIAVVALILTLVSNKDHAILPMLGTIALGAYRILQPLQQCFNSFSRLESNIPSLQNLELFLEPSSEEISQQNIFRPDPPTTPCEKLNDRKYSIQFRNVSYSYPQKDNYAIKNLTLNFEGKLIAIVGRSGCGKSTLGDLVLGLLSPNKGKIYTSYGELSNLKSIKTWQQEIAHVPQNIYLSDDSVAANIAFGVPSQYVDNSRVVFASSIAGIDGVIDTLPEKYDTIIGENGQLLSGGQRQRIGIARAIYKDSKLILLDEGTSALDRATELQVISAMKNSLTDVTIIMITHRLKILDIFDQVIYMNSNGLVASGTYAQLIAECHEFSEYIHDKKMLIND
jgi:ABC-type multidrug transport system fused ATPase/permease subunit